MKFDDYILHTNFKRKATEAFHENQFHQPTKISVEKEKFIPNKWDDNFRTWAVKQSEIPKVKMTKLVNTITNTEGLNRAYHQGDVYAHGNTMYIAGSHTATDWYDDFTKVPVWGDLRNAERYKKAEEVLKLNPKITNVIGHSLGGSVALELEKNYPQLKNSRTFGAPVFEPFGQESEKVARYRNWLDPMSIADRSAVNSSRPNPLSTGSLTHDYSNIADNFISQRTTDIIDDSNGRWDVRTE